MSKSQQKSGASGGSSNSTNDSVLYDIHDFLKLLQNVKRMSNGYSALCPSHSDNNNSLSIDEGNDGRILLNCHAGCSTADVVSALGLKMKDLFPKSATTTGTRGSASASAPAPAPAPSSAAEPPTVESLAADKGLPIKFLSYYAENMPFGVKIIYKNADGTLAARQRLRTALSAKDGSRWSKGDGAPIVYGAWRVKRMATKSDTVQIMEGESDLWTAWYHDIAALGIPGADMASKLTKQDIEPFKRVILWQEPDKGGDTFIAGMAKRLEELGYTGEAFVIQGPPDELNGGQPVKDLNELHKRIVRSVVGSSGSLSDINDPDVAGKVKTAFKTAWDSLLGSEAQESPHGNIEHYPQDKPPTESNVDNVAGDETNEADEADEAVDEAVESPINPASNIIPLDVSVREQRQRKKAAQQAAQVVCQYALTDMGNADRLIHYYGDNILFCYAWKRWLIWSGRHWQTDETGEIDRLAESTAKRIADEAQNVSDRDMYAEIMNHAKRSQSATLLKFMLDRARNRRPATSEQFDKDIMLFNAQNGTIDLRTGALRPHSQSDMITKISPAAYDPTAADVNSVAPTWMKFLRRITNGDEELVLFLQRIAGYALTGDTSEHSLFFLYGEGRNGKSTFVNTLAHVIGTYGQTVRPDVLMAKPQGDGIPNEIAALTGVRYISTTETEKGRRLAEAMLKQFTGGDSVSARFLYGEFFRFKPQFKIFLASNDKPVIRGQDKAIWERIHLIPFTVFITKAERDIHLEEKLHAEASGILAWAVQGCLAWQRDGLRPPEAVRAATQDYQSEMDLLGDFLEDCCILREGAFCLKPVLWNVYIRWCGENKVKTILSRRDFCQNLAKKGVSDTKKAGVRAWCGIGLLDSVHVEDNADDKTDAREGRSADARDAGTVKSHKPTAWYNRDSGRDRDDHSDEDDEDDLY